MIYHLILNVIKSFVPIKIGVICMVVLCFQQLAAQNQAIRFQLDNDWFTDQYYSAGIDLSYHRSFTKWSQKQIEHSYSWSAHYGFQIYTPNVYDEESFTEMSQDRPFAGYQYIGFKLHHYAPNNTYQSYRITLGQVGPSAGAESIQRFAHKSVGYEPIFGWENQIVDEVVIDLGYQWTKEWLIDSQVGLSTTNMAQVGTSKNYIQTGVQVRFGEFNTGNQSSWQQPRINDSGSKNAKAESYVFGGLNAQYVFSNILIEGSLFDNPSPVTMPLHPLFVQGEIGLAIAAKKTAFNIVAVFQGREFEGGTGHFYLNFNIARSF